MTLYFDRLISMSSVRSPISVKYVTGVKIYTDGACRGNPGPGGWGAVMLYRDRVRELSGGDRHTTNNRMELTAVIKALAELRKSAEIDVYSDSSYVVKGMTGWIHDWKRRGWKRASGSLENVDLWRELAELADLHRIRWHWVRGHSGDPLNERADELAKTAVPSVKDREKTENPTPW